MFNWTDERIREYYDSTPDLTLFELSHITGLTVKQLKKVLMT